MVENQLGRGLRGEMQEGHAVRHGQTILKGEQTACLLAWGIRFFLTAALTATQKP